jgi:hypothetical protein
MKEYEQAAVKLSQDPEPDIKRMSRAEVRAHLVKGIRKSARMHGDFEARAKRLNPPEKYRKTNELLIAFMGGQARNEEEWARLIEARNPEARKMDARINREMMDRFRPLIEEIMRVEPKDAERLGESLRSLERQMAEM